MMSLTWSLDSFMEDKDSQLNDLVRNIAVGALELVKDQVRIQQWKIREELVKEANEPDNQEESMEYDHQSL